MLKAIVILLLTVAATAQNVCQSNTFGSSFVFGATVDGNFGKISILNDQPLKEILLHLPRVVS